MTLNGNRRRTDLSHPVAGVVYGDLTVIGFRGRDSSGGAVWAFRCSCGRTLKKSARNVVNPNGQAARHCGCKRVWTPPRRCPNSDYRGRNERIIDLSELGLTYGGIAAVLGLTRCTVAGVLRKYRQTAIHDSMTDGHARPEELPDDGHYGHLVRTVLRTYSEQHGIEFAPDQTELVKDMVNRLSPNAKPSYVITAIMMSVQIVTGRLIQVELPNE
jgi:hypothetical protein